MPALCVCIESTAAACLPPPTPDPRSCREAAAARAGLLTWARWAGGAGTSRAPPEHRATHLQRQYELLEEAAGLPLWQPPGSFHILLQVAATHVLHHYGQVLQGGGGGVQHT